ncbi:hypothetical protein L6452_17131 [Arctium lappa]|uniref:Uncharacterized protein n=1 Tax=Arctium lappa TaxID=4217 RepID=A0ACB9C2J0_ARCLA|nr:hypothetical protein L6452_17131 [Arctium lappa]
MKAYRIYFLSSFCVFLKYIMFVYDKYSRTLFIFGETMDPSSFVSTFNVSTTFTPRIWSGILNHYSKIEDLHRRLEVVRNLKRKLAYEASRFAAQREPKDNFIKLSGYFVNMKTSNSIKPKKKAVNCNQTAKPPPQATSPRSDSVVPDLTLHSATALSRYNPSVYSFLTVPVSLKIEMPKVLEPLILQLLVVGSPSGKLVQIEHALTAVG